MRYQLIVAAVSFAVLIFLGRVLYAYLSDAYRAYQRGRDRAFRDSYVRGRTWLAEFMAEAEHSIDNRDFTMRYKSHPARKSADTVRDIKREKRELTLRVKLLEYQLKSYEEYFPQLADYREQILNEDLALAEGGDNENVLDEIDPVRKYISRADWERLSPATRNQRALDAYIARQKTHWEIGRAYERYLGYLREKAGWNVTYHGALFGLADFGRDLVCEIEDRVEIVQAKRWGHEKFIRENHVFQLFGTTLHFRLGHSEKRVTAVLATTAPLSPEAELAAELLEVRVERTPMTFDYPMIKCNINRATGEKIYHLPFDQMYDRTVIRNPGELYVKTTREAERAGFRRAWRHYIQSGTTD